MRSHRVKVLAGLAFGLCLVMLVLAAGQEPAARAQAKAKAAQPAKPYTGVLDVEPKPIAADPAVKWDYPIVYVRAPRGGDRVRPRFTEVGDPRTMDAGADLVILHPSGKEEVLVPVAKHESIADPFVSFDGEWVYYAKMHDALNHKGSDIYKVHVPTRKVVQLTSQKFTPNTGAADWSKTPLPRWGVYNLGPTPAPGGKIVFVSDRNAFKGTNTGYAPHALALQLFIMDEDGSNVECIGHLNLGMALHPAILKDGRIMFSSLESQGLRSHHLWGIWAIHPDGTNWSPLVSAFDRGGGTTDSFHFQAQLADESIVFESYYNLNNHGMGLYFKQPIGPPSGTAPFGPGHKEDPRNPPLRDGRLADGRGTYLRFPFSPYGIETLTPFIKRADQSSPAADLSRKDSPRLGKFTHPSGAPDNHMLTVWSPGAVQGTPGKPVGGAPGQNYAAPDAGLYFIKQGKPFDEPGQMLLIKNDPRYNEQWPRALVPYQRIYGIAEPPVLGPLVNDGQRSKHLPAGTPFGLVGTSSLYKRESYPYGVVKEGSVTATFAATTDPTGLRGHDGSHPNWTVQGADAGLYRNEDIHAIRIVLLEPNTDRQGGPKAGKLFYNHANERMRILGEFPVRKFDPKESAQPLDPDGNPDTSFLARLPADVAWTFQTLDRNGMVLNMAQTWHQLRPGEIRTDCGGCHAHSQKPTLFEQTAAARPGYVPFDLTRKTPLLTSKANDQSGKQWDVKNQTGLRYESGPKTVEYHRDVQPILERSCVACHTQKWEKPAGNLVLDDIAPYTLDRRDNPVFGNEPASVPGTYARLAMDPRGNFGHPSLHRHGWKGQGLRASRYIQLMQSRRSLLAWKVFGQRLDGWSNDDFPHETVPGDPKSLQFRGQPLSPESQFQPGANVPPAQPAFLGSAMPPPEAVAGTYAGPDGQKIKVAPLSDEDRLTLARWIDLGCPIDLDYDASQPKERGYGLQLDDQRPTLTLPYPRPGLNRAPLTRILVGMHDLNAGLDLDSLHVSADFAIDGSAAGENLAKKLQPGADNVWQWTLAQPLQALPRGKLTVSVKDKQGNITAIERSFSIAPAK